MPRRRQAYRDASEERGIGHANARICPLDRSDMVASDEDGDDHERVPTIGVWAKLEAILLIALLGHLRMAAQELQLSNTGFGAMQSALSLLGTVMPIVGGLLVDRMGCDLAALISTGTILVGLVILVASLSGAWFAGTLVGLTLIGVAGSWVGTAQDAAVLRLYPKAHGGHRRQGEVAFVFGILFAIGKVVGGGGASCTWPSGDHAHRLAYDVVLILSPAVGGYLALEFLLGGAWIPFLHLSSNMIKVLYGIEAKHAAWLASIIMAIPIGMYLVVGTILDKMQRRTWIVTIGTFFLFLAFVVMLVPSTSAVVASLPPILVSLSISLVPLALIVSVPRLVTAAHVGVLLGLHRCLENAGAVWIGALAGILQDTAQGSYHGVVRMFVVISAMALAMAFAFQYLAGPAVDGAGIAPGAQPHDQAYTTLEQHDSPPSPATAHFESNGDNQHAHIGNPDQPGRERNGTGTPSIASASSSLCKQNSNGSSESISNQYGSQTDIAMRDQEKGAIERRHRRHEHGKQSPMAALPLHNVLCAAAVCLSIVGSFVIFIAVTLAR
ncbi:hypothetical protein SYNPS1DRAFT_28359 [Syncephalis pseudoplumigaleata]|uniref:Major facilitator superfamily domain-containing protein n=1 Tax=Syncephalis pseudoplumigaleata TaxID=1712513 RepID=A0A4P9Z0U9_9FUNG|nr:hypothetical protein SYNPS1DRAFT_28359 [Syncephalis pseudoplumigaleata]|eukprot:RKP25928.1 hypothetical protein SYNPS1DRAFT_28359 [Syncephalis pseudoplumigaleata]